MPKKLTYAEALEAINSERFIKPDEVKASAQRRVVWGMLYSAPGCLPDNRSYGSTKAEAIGDAQLIYGDDAPRGFVTELRRNQIAAVDSSGYYRVEIVRMTLGELLS